MVHIGRYDDSYLLAKAEELVNDKVTGSKVMDPEEENRVYRFGPNGKWIRFLDGSQWLGSTKCMS